MWAIGATTELEYGSNGEVSQARYVGHDFGKGAPLGLFTYGAVANTVGNQLTSYKYQYPYTDSRGYVAEKPVSVISGPTAPITRVQML